MVRNFSFFNVAVDPSTYHIHYEAGEYSMRFIGTYLDGAQEIEREFSLEGKDEKDAESLFEILKFVFCLNRSVPQTLKIVVEVLDDGKEVVSVVGQGILWLWLRKDKYYEPVCLGFLQVFGMLMEE
ncbi:MAG: hypothetical protein HFJ45_06110 [Clostridia bacterium]|nr:hypothetical protein [Clostridia bacterium]